MHHLHPVRLAQCECLVVGQHPQYLVQNYGIDLGEMILIVMTLNRKLADGIDCPILQNPVDQDCFLGH